MKKTLVLGASTSPSRYSHLAVKRLQELGIEVVAVGNKKGEIAGTPILTGKPELEDIHTVTLYLNPLRQTEYYDYVLGLAPKRVIFNPGTENAVFMKKLRDAGVEVEIACSLVLLGTGQY